MRLLDTLGIDLPIIQAPMAGAQGSALVVAVSNAGGLGSLPCAMLGADALRQELAALRAQTTKPFNVNFFCHRLPVSDPARELAWKSALAPYFRELGIVPDAAPAGAQRLPFSADIAELLAEYRPPVVSFHFGLPEPALVAHLRSWGAKILSSATTVEEARWLAARGVDAVIAQGLEAGGHRGHFLSADLDGQTDTLTLLQQLVRAVDVPVIAAGGIADAGGVRAAMALGAAGVQVGTAYLLCTEATTSAVHRAALKSHASGDTALTNLFTGRPARSIVNRLMREQGPMNALAPDFPLAAAVIAALRAKAERLGSGDFSPLWAGQNARACKEVSAATLTRELAGAGVTTFRDFTPADTSACLAIFDLNCPAFFAPEERADYADFLAGEPGTYELCLCGDRVAGAFGLIPGEAGRARLNWILRDPAVKGGRIGSAMMRRAIAKARELGAAHIDIAASHLSEPFFERFGARTVSRRKDGWGPGMHRHDMVLKM